MKSKYFVPALFLVTGVTGLLFYTSLNSKGNKVQESPSIKPITADSTFCAELKDGIVVVTLNNSEIYDEVTTGAGLKVFPDGMVILPDGSQLFLHDGECIDQRGNPTGHASRKK